MSLLGGWWIAMDDQNFPRRQGGSLVSASLLDPATGREGQDGQKITSDPRALHHPR
jgi:hypothetical protein